MAYSNGNGRSDPERHAFEQEVISLMSQMRAYCRSLTGNASAAEDLVQDTIFRALKAWKSFTPGTSLRAWLFIIARNTFLSEMRRSKFRAEWDPDLIERSLTSDGEILEAEASLDFRRLLLCLACISRNQSDALIAVGYLGLSYEDTAERFGCAVGTIKSRVARGRAELASWFEGTGAIPEVDLSWLRTASVGIPKSHPHYPIAKAYEELYTEFCSGGPSDASPESKSEDERAWNDLVASGALDSEPDDLDSLMRYG